MVSCYSPLSAVVLSQSDIDTDSVSSASTSDNDIPIIIKPQPQPHWETFDDLDTQCPPPLPPPPPPRAELQQSLETLETGLEQSTTPVNLLSESLGSSNPFGDFDYEASPDESQIQSELVFNVTESNLDNGRAGTSEVDSRNQPSPFESLHLDARPVSPFDDFSSSVAQALRDNSQIFEDPSAANALINTSLDLSTVIEEDENNMILSNASALIETSPELPQPLIPTTTTASTTQDIATELIRSQVEMNMRKGSAPVISSAIASPYGYRESSSAPDFQMQASGTQGTHTQNSSPFYNYGYQHMTYTSKDLKRPAGPRSPKFAQDIPLSIPQVPLNYQKKRLPPPPKPQPYSRAQATQSGVNKDDPMLQRLSSIGEFNPFQSLLGDVGMEDYVKRNANKETPLV